MARHTSHFSDAAPHRFAVLGPGTASTGSQEGLRPLSTLSFMKEVIRANKSTGAIAPSGKQLANIVTEMAEVAPGP